MTKKDNTIELDVNHMEEDLVRKLSQNTQDYQKNDDTVFLRLVGRFKIKNRLIRELVAEFFGTFILILFGCSGVAQFKLNAKADSSLTNLLSVNIAFGFGTMVSILLVGKISGAQLNPAVSIAMYLTKRLTFLKFMLYSVSQFLGAFLGAAFVYLLYLDGLNSFGDKKYSLDTAGIFSTYPNAGLSVMGSFFDQIVGTAVLLLAVLSISDKKNMNISQEKGAVLVALILVVIGCSFGYNCGYAINPARDLGPRLFTSIAGWGTQVFTAGNYYFWIPIVGPMLGSVIGTFLYYVIVSNNL